MKKPRLLELEGRSLGYYFVLFVLAVFIAAGLAAFIYMEHEGHWVSNMNNQIVWGTPHVFAVFLIVAASGALNVASISSVFGRTIYKPLAPFSALLALCLLAGGLAILVLDLGRPERLIVAMTKYNFKSIFAWNMILYNGFFAIVLVYLWMMLERRFNQYSKIAGFFAFVWRLILTTGTGSIFGFLVARDAYDSAILAPSFIVMSFAYGLAIFVIYIVAAYAWSQREIGPAMLMKLRRLLGVFIAASLYFVAVYHLTNLYITGRHGIESFILLGTGDLQNMDATYMKVFWFGQILIGGVIPLALIYMPGLKCRASLILASVLVIIGGISQMYVTIIGGQAYPLEIFPGKSVASSFSDGVINAYSPSMPEVALGLSGIAIALFLTTFVIKVLRILPESLADADVDPHYVAETKAA